MALVSITAGPDGWQGERDLSGALQALPDGAAVTVMVHGFRFAPGAAAHDPHRHILALAPTRSCWKAVSWPRHLHLDRPVRDLASGLAGRRAGGWTGLRSAPSTSAPRWPA
jgi:hypothetical protein